MVRFCQPITATLVFVSVFASSDLWCQSVPQDREANPSPEPGWNDEERHAFGYLDSIVLGLVEGVTEFLPISSTGHLILAGQALGLNGDATLGTPVVEAESAKAGKAALDAFIIVIQAGAIAAVAVLYWDRIAAMLAGVMGRDREGRLLALNLLAAFFPAVVAGVALGPLVEKYLFNTWNVAIALFAGGLLMLGVDRLRADPGVDRNRESGLELHDLSVRQSLFIGALQCVALWPGASRSMMTIVGGYLTGLSRRRAAEFSFLLGLPTLTGAAVYKGARSGPAMLETLGLGPVLVGCLVAAVSAGLAVKWMVGYLSRHGFALFGWYRIALAFAIFAIYLA